MTRESIHTFGDGPYVAQDYEVEGDFSQASYFFAAAAITGGVVTVEGLNQTSKQGDKYLLDVLQDGGCEVEWKGNACTVSGKCTVLPASIDMGNYPDIVQTVAAIAAHIHKKTTIINIAHLAHKETDRIANTVKALNSVGVQAESDSDSITIHGGSVQGGIVETYNDHRMAMSMAVLALGASDKTEIRDAEVVNKSYPNFWTVLKTLIKTMNIVLIGMRGSGKSSVGRLLSQELDMHFVDLDEVLQREQGKKIKDIVTSEGWDAFRKYESEIVDDVKDCDNTVISTGGGVILNPENTKKLKEHGYIIWLSGGVDTLIKRIGKGANRPSLTGKPLREDLHETLKTRETLYKEASNLTIDTDDKSLEEILKEINMALKETTNND